MQGPLEFLELKLLQLFSRHGLDEGIPVFVLMAHSLASKGIGIVSVFAVAKSIWKVHLFKPMSHLLLLQGCVSLE